MFISHFFYKYTFWGIIIENSETEREVLIPKFWCYLNNLSGYVKATCWQLVLFGVSYISLIYLKILNFQKINYNLHPLSALVKALSKLISAQGTYSNFYSTIRITIIHPFFKIFSYYIHTDAEINPYTLRQKTE